MKVHPIVNKKKDGFVEISLYDMVIGKKYPFKHNQNIYEAMRDKDNNLILTTIEFDEDEDKK